MSKSDYIKESLKKSKTFNHYSLYGSQIPIYIKDDLIFTDQKSSLEEVIKIIENSLPSFFVSNVDVIYVGDFSHFEERETNAAYENGAIYVINVQDNAVDMADDIVHEIAHAVEEKFYDNIYGDGRVENEFLGKREKLFQLLKAYNEPLVDFSFFKNPMYDEEFDEYLYTVLGYPLLSSYTSGLFYSPYSATSVREYFARGFEAFFLYKDLKTLASVSPILYNRIETLADME
tara:strand:- start:5698 stop:6393 length:696 start_codon:yes stop_codon:yes gene_type:complete